MTTEFQADVPNVEKSQIDKPTVDINIGNRLKAKRAERGFDEREVATELKIPIDQVRALESNNFGYFRSKTFARGYLKAYCRFLEMDQTEILIAFDAMQPGVESTIKPVDKVINKQTKFGDPIVMLVSAVIIAVLIFLAVWWPSFSSKNTAAIDKNPPVANSSQANTPSQGNTSSPVVSSTPPALDPLNEQDVDSDTASKTGDTDISQSQAAAASAADESTDAKVHTQKDDGVTTGMSAETIALLENSGVNAKKVEQETKAVDSADLSQPSANGEPAQPAPTYTNDIEATFDADCWVEVRDSTGKILYSGVKNAGDKLDLTGTPPYRVVLGYARGVSSFDYKGESFDFSSYTHKDLARFELK